VCHASVHDGRWQWLDAKTGCKDVVCPACQRIKDELPAGMVSIEGGFFGAHRVELLNLVQKLARRAEALHPLRRLMNVADTPEGVTVTTTDTHLARELGQALHDAYDGKLIYSPADGQKLLRVHWKR
jgi:NMD protein affecting ribosome stability and mRNA decay